IERNVWDGNNFAIILQPDYSHEEESFRYDSIIGFTKILNDGANKEWIWKDSLIACVWDAKYDGTSHPFLYRVGCNIIPIADVINDIRDSKRCALSLDRDFVDEVVCGIVYAASLFDVAKYVGLLTAVGFVAGTVIDVGPATAKSAAKEAATELALGLGKVARGNIIGTIKSPTIPFKLLWTFTKLTFRGVTDPVGTLKGLLHVLQHGKDVALATLEFIRIFFKQEWDYQAIEGAGYLHKFKETLEVDYNGLKPELVPSMSKMFSEGQFEFSFKTSVNELRLGNNLPTGIIFRDPGNGRFFIDFTPRQFSINPGKIGISAQPDAVYKGLYFFRHPDINIRNDFRNLANMDSKELNKYLNGIGKEDEYLKLEQAYFSDIQNNFLRHELVHNKFDAFGDVNTLVKRNPDCGPNEGWCDPYNLLRFFDETLADDFNFKSINEQGQLKQYKEILYQRNIWVGIDSLDNGAPSKNVYDEGLSFTESLVKNDFNKKIPEEIVRQRILLKGIDPSGIRLKDFDAEVLRILKNDEIIKNRFSTPEELFGLINDLTKNYEDNLKKVSKIMEKSSFSYDDVQEFKIILQEVYDKTHQIRDIFY
ncbi:hypothetical protein HYU13_03140, partial [Candidatus Woesearchaeota archaeon]|nr:hypothetical protein [Candidatus Woesearchaeota archaeon]